MRRLLTVLASALLLATTACALVEDPVEIRYGALRTAATVAGSDNVRVTVGARDQRTQYRDRVSVKKNGYGMEMARIFATNDIVAETERAVAAELVARGFREPGPDARLELDLLRFYSDFKIGFFAGGAEAEVVIAARVLGRDGRPAYARTYSGQNTVQPILLADGSNARLALEGALQRAVQSMMDDPALIGALLAQAPPPPSAEPPPRTGRRPRPVS